MKTEHRESDNDNDDMSTGDDASISHSSDDQDSKGSSDDIKKSLQSHENQNSPDTSHPFVLKRFNSNMKKCYGCRKKFVGPGRRPRYVIGQVEPAEYYERAGGRRPCTGRNVRHYHCQCVPGGQSSLCAVTASPRTLQRLTVADVVDLASRDELRLSFVDACVLKVQNEAANNGTVSKTETD